MGTLRLKLPPRRILAARGGAMGDFIVTLPSLAALRQAFPEAHLALLAHPAHAALAAADGLCDESRSLESAGLAPFFSPQGKPDCDWRAWMGSFDVVVSWLADGDGVFQKNARASGAGAFLQGPWKFEDSQPVAGQLAAALTPLGIGFESPHYPFRFCHRSRKDVLAVHPGSGSERKNWPASHWRMLLAEWHRLHPQSGILIITGEAESEEALALPERLRAEGIPCEHSHGLSLTSLCHLLAGSRLYLGHDTGISHLAAACGLPCRLIFGPASPSIWIPPAPNVAVFRTANLSALAPVEFLAWLRSTSGPS